MRRLGCLLEKDVKINQQRARAIKNAVALLITASTAICGTFAPASTMAGEKRDVKINQLGGGGTLSLLKAESNISVSLTLSFEGEDASVVANVSPEISEDSVSYNWKVGNELEDDSVSGNVFHPDDDDFEKWIEVTAHVGGKDYTDKLYYSNLPVMYVNTDDKDSVITKEGYLPGKMTIQGNSKYQGKEYEYKDQKISIKGRGNGSWVCPKKPYKLKLDKKANLLGLDGESKNKHWVLLANYADVASVRYKLASLIGEQSSIDHMNTEWVDLIINGEYAGLYQLSQHIRVGKDRVDIYDWEDEADELAKTAAKSIAKADNLDKEVVQDELEEYLEQNLDWVTSRSFSYNGKNYNVEDYRSANDTGNDDITGGYLFQLDHYYDTLTKFRTNKGLNIMLESPECLSSNQLMLSYVQNYWQEYEDSYRAVDGYNKYGKSYSDYADMDSMVGLWFANELMSNWDARSGSRYAHKDKNEKLIFGPLWDFDHSCDDQNTYGWYISQSETSGWPSKNQNVFREWLDDPYFCLNVYECYWKNRFAIARCCEDGGEIDQWGEYLAKAGEADGLLWARPRSYEADKNVIKKYLNGRLNWMDGKFVSLDNLINSIRTKESTTPYTKADVQLRIVSGNLIRRVDTADNWATDYLLEKDSDAEIGLCVNDENTKTISAYVNGIKLENGDDNAVTDGKCAFTVSSNALGLEDGKRTMVSFVGWDSNGDYTYTNYLTISPTDEESVEVRFIDSEGNDLGIQRYMIGEEVWNYDRLLARSGYTYKLFSDENLENAYDFSNILSGNDVIYVRYIKGDCAHDVVRTEFKEPNCTENGNIEYYTCSKCGRIFSDELCENEINLSDTVIEAYGHKFEDSVVEPTTDSEGYTLHTCKVCGFSYTDNYKEKLAENEKKEDSSGDNEDNKNQDDENNDNSEPEKESTVISNPEKQMKHYSVLTDADKVFVGGKTDIKNLFNVSSETKYRFYSSDKKIAKVSKKGIVVGKKEGKVTITMKVKEGDVWTVKESREITIKMPSIRQKEEVKVGHNFNASQSIIESDYLPTKWASSNPKVLRVDPESGEVETLKAGKAKIYAVFGEGKLSTKKKYRTKYIVSK